LNLLIDAFVRRLSHGIIKFSHSFYERCFPSSLGVVLKILVFISSVACIFLLGIKFIVLSMSGKNNAKISLSLKLINSLLKSFIDALHFEVLFLNLSQISSHLIDVNVVGMDDILILIELFYICCDQFVDISFNGIHFVGELSNLSV